MASLTGSTIASSYEQLLCLPDGGGNTSNLVAVTDGDGGTTFCISLTDASTGKAVLAVDGSHANGTEIQIDNSATDGDAFLSFQLSGTSKFTMGVDDGDSDKFKIGTTAIGTGTMFALDTSSKISLSNNDSGGTGGSDSTSGNTIFGWKAGEDIASGGLDNTYFGHNAGNQNTTGDKNTYVGANAGEGVNGNANSFNTAIGREALLSVTTGSNNTVIGSGSGDALADGEQNVAVGANSLSTSTGIDGTVAIGYGALNALTSGAGNTAIGFESLKTEDAGSGNVAVGYQALETLNNDNGYNIAMGHNAMQGATTAYYNICIGKDTGTAMAAAVPSCVIIGHEAGDAINHADAGGTVAIGRSAGGAISSGTGNTVIGYQAGAAIVTGIENTIVGYQAHDVGVGDGNVAIGKAAMGSMSHATSDKNTAIGTYALLSTGSNESIGQVAVGYSALQDCTSGVGNVAIGYQSLDALTDGDRNTAVGYQSFSALATSGNTGGTAVGYKAGYALTSGGYNTIMGRDSLATATTASSCVAIGDSAMANSPSGVNFSSIIAIGPSAMTDTSSLTNAANGAIAIGSGALNALTSGARNTAIGYAAGDTIQNGSSNTIVGYGCDTDTTGRSDCVIIGDRITLSIASDEVVEIGNATNSMTYDLGGGDITVSSDVRIKKDIEDTKIGLEFINKIRPVTYRRRPTSEWPEEFGALDPSDESRDKVWDGLIAQEVKAVMDEMGVGFSGWQESANTKQILSYGKFVMPLIKAVQELSQQVEELKAKIN